MCAINMKLWLFLSFEIFLVYCYCCSCSSWLTDHHCAFQTCIILQLKSKSKCASVSSIKRNKSLKLISSFHGRCFVCFITKPSIYVLLRSNKWIYRINDYFITTCMDWHSFFTLSIWWFINKRSSDRLYKIINQPIFRIC